jgi:hypothetical protein
MTNETGAATAALFVFAKKYRRELLVLLALYMVWVVLFGTECGIHNLMLGELGAVCPAHD